ncbi:hypothetical protein GCM10011611_06410 [Aliidongia dinghuensis]|uniref:Uncharacterized protein n=2 Tax=Aliidongia dinghuensis TaxID=1867774 RepID=A0A8J3E1S0_9PROT|nr:hypothetical protein GCM10011611_06410 [Aliidongia dinghuensis]
MLGAAILIGYAAIFSVSLLTVGFLEIRQANMVDFNALIAVLDQRDRYKDDHLQDALKRAELESAGYPSRIATFNCTDSPSAAIVVASALATSPVSADPEEAGAKPKSCAEIRDTLLSHAHELSLTEDDVRFRSANLAFYYDSYVDGITQKSPQIIPALLLLDSKFWPLTVWARAPFELIQMFLLVCMGMLGGVISVMRYFVDPAMKSPAIAEFFYKPAAGAAISIGVYVLFRAAQIFLGIQNQNGSATISTSVFILAGFGLASGLCATEALGQIQSVAIRLLRVPGRGTYTQPTKASRLSPG